MTDKPNIEALSREFCELTGICWHEIAFDLLWIHEFPYCKHCEREDISWHWEYPNGKCVRIADSNPDFTDAREVLKVMVERNDWPDFIRDRRIGKVTWSVIGQRFLLIDAYYILDTTGLMLQVAVEWLRKEKSHG